MDTAMVHGPDAHSSADFAATCMRRGIELLAVGDSDADREALRLFDAAIAERSAGPLQDPRARYDLAGAWMNRAEAMTRLAPAEPAAAVEAFDRAIALLSDPAWGPHPDSPPWRRRIAIAWNNRGQTFSRQRGREAARAAASSFRNAIEALGGVAHDAEDQRVLGSAWANHANALLRMDSRTAAREARKAAREALAILDALEQADLTAAEAALQARHARCRALAGLIDRCLSKRPRVAAALLAEATDTVEEGLNVARHWEMRGVARLRDLAGDLFRFGVRAYQAAQPQFLSEFILDSVDPERSPAPLPLTRALHAAALDSLWRHLRTSRKESVHAGEDPWKHLLEIAPELERTEARLRELRKWEK
jgi:tetratricopeptide (TPR) repeat protein